MKRGVYILLAVLIIGVIIGIGMVAAAELQQKGKSSVYTMDVAFGENGVGTLMVNTEKHTFVLNAEGCDPSAQYWLYYMVDASRHFAWDIHNTYSGSWGIFLDTAVATEDGTVHMSGVYDSDVYTDDPVTIYDLSTIAVTKFAAGVYAKTHNDNIYYIYPWFIGSGIDKVIYQEYRSTGPTGPIEKQFPLPLYHDVEVLGLYYVTVTIVDNDGNEIMVTWYPPETSE